MPTLKTVLRNLSDLPITKTKRRINMLDKIQMALLVAEVTDQIENAIEMIQFNLAAAESNPTDVNVKDISSKNIKYALTQLGELAKELIIIAHEPLVGNEIAEAGLKKLFPDVAAHLQEIYNVEHEVLIRAQID